LCRAADVFNFTHAETPEEIQTRRKATAPEPVEDGPGLKPRFLSSQQVVFDIRGRLKRGIAVLAAEKCDVDAIGEQNRSDNDPDSSHSRVVAGFY
jgi:hypothetical protein